jgi:hypothetical protein
MMVVPGSVGLSVDAPITPAGMPSSSITSDTMPVGSPSAMKRSMMPAGGRGTDISLICSAAMRPVSCLRSLLFMGVLVGSKPIALHFAPGMPENLTI